MYKADIERWFRYSRMLDLPTELTCGIQNTKVLMIMFGSTASSSNCPSKKGRSSFGCTVLFSFLRRFNLMLQEKFHNIFLADSTAVDSQQSICG